MSTPFRKPDFGTGELELRFEDGVVCIYGTENGLKRLAELCTSLTDRPDMQHLHLENWSILTQASEKGAVAIFPARETEGKSRDGGAVEKP